jgi:hypothetical protein
MRSPLHEVLYWSAWTVAALLFTVLVAELTLTLMTTS